MKIIAHTMEYRGGRVISPLRLRGYSPVDYDEYKKIYEECFRDMRTALRLSPVDCCDSGEELARKREAIHVLEIDGELIGSVAIYGHEIDDLFVKKSAQGKGYGEALLRFAVSELQRKRVAPIVLHVADWNRRAIGLYVKNGFVITRTEAV